MLKGFEVHFHQFWYTNGVVLKLFQLGILMTPYFFDGMTMGCFTDENDNNGSSFQ